MIGRPLLKTIAPSAVLLALFGQPLHHQVIGDANKFAGSPRVILWAWERPERLSFLDSPDVGVAYLAQTINQHKDSFSVHRRFQPLEIPKDTFLEAVVRIETERSRIWSLSDIGIDELATAIVAVVDRPGVRALQIDFDARESERSFYKQLLKKTKERLPKEIPLSITALASWCMQDRWLDDAPVDEIVPMLFSMGAGKQESLHFIESCPINDLGAFKESFGIAVYDSRPADSLAKRIKLNATRIYFFSTYPWNPKSVKHAYEEVRLWQRSSPI